MNAHAATATSHFDQLLQAAAREPQPQRLLFVFTTAELPPDATPAQRARFERGEGGSLTPLMCVDKTLDELKGGFPALASEARAYGPPWQVVFVAALSGAGGRQPTDAQVDAAMERMVDAVKRGEIGGFAAYDGHGEPLQLAA